MCCRVEFLCPELNSVLLASGWIFTTGPMQKPFINVKNLELCVFERINAGFKKLCSYCQKRSSQPHDGRVPALLQPLPPKSFYDEDFISQMDYSDMITITT